MLPKKNDLIGIVVSVFLGLLALFLAGYTPSFFNSVFLALLFGIGINNFIQLPKTIDPGLTFTSGRMLELSIVFLAFSINYSSFIELGFASFGYILIAIFIVLILVVFLSKKFNCPSSTGWLIGFGTAICGSSAIAALAPNISKEKEDIAVSMAVVNLYGSIGMILLPLILLQFPFTANQIGFVLGGSLHSVGNVVGAGYSISNEVGEASMTIKLARVALLSPALLFFNFLVNRNSMNSWKDYIKLPWYLIVFFGISLVGSFIQFPDELVKNSEFLGKLVLTIAMAAIGLKVKFSTLINSGKKGLLFGLVIFLIYLSLLVLGVLFI
jgi:uncharacterized integral membrane protein (TIGR00698 family)